MSKLTYILFATFLLSGAANAATFNVVLDTDTVDGAGTITIDDSLITPGGTVNYLDPLVQISVNFNGFAFDTGFDESPVGGDTVFQFDAFGEIVGVDDQTPVGSSFTDLRATSNPDVIVAINDGPIPGTFVFFDLTVADTPLLRGNISITRVSEVPVPPALPMLGAALFGLGLVRRRSGQRKL